MLLAFVSKGQQSLKNWSKDRKHILLSLLDCLLPLSIVVCLWLQCVRLPYRSGLLLFQERKMWLGSAQYT